MRGHIEEPVLAFGVARAEYEDLASLDSTSTGERIVPTHESSEAFAKLVQTRDRLNEITRRLNEAESSEPGVEKLKKEWDLAFREFESATKSFYAAVRKLRKKMDARQSNKDSN